MLCAGAEIGRTQQGNNNAYCQDGELSWIDWRLDGGRRALLEFTRTLVEIRARHPVFRRRRFFQGRQIRGSEIRDLTWFRPDGTPMTEDDWVNPGTRCLGLRLAGDAINEVDVDGNRILDDTFLVLLNAHHEPLEFVLPAHRSGVRWHVLVDTRAPEPPRRVHRWRGG